MFRTEKVYQDLERKPQQIKEERDRDMRMGLDIPAEFDDYDDNLKEIEKKKYFISRIIIGFIISPEIDRSNFVNRAEELISKNDKFKLVYDTNNEMIFGNVKVNLAPFNL